MSENKPDKYIQVLTKIRELNDKGIPAPFTKLCEELPNLEKTMVLDAIYGLKEWDLIYGCYGDIGNDRVGYQYFIKSIATTWLDSYKRK
jgi:hypothetical protein